MHNKPVYTEVVPNQAGTCPLKADRLLACRVARDFGACLSPEIHGYVVVSGDLGRLAITPSLLGAFMTSYPQTLSRPGYQGAITLLAWDIFGFRQCHHPNAVFEP